ncbi:hypothetical protein HJG60_009424 [Phyllostomus discolor]|uniref:Uncharacterized protein n=1 Tax=Phyllostomus discolor TaxID=89673 RepID=A0A833YJP9_9CHIR|nr:hypothetical protein HJG60_009424 [Phyllostomus discolor]
MGVQSGPRRITGGVRAPKCGGALAPVHRPPLRFFPLPNPRAKPTRLVSPGKYIARFKGLRFSKLVLRDLQDFWPEPLGNRPGCGGFRRAWPGSQRNVRGSFPPGAHKGPRKGQLCTRVCVCARTVPPVTVPSSLGLLGTSANTRPGDWVVLSLCFPALLELDSNGVGQVARRPCKWPEPARRCVLWPQWDAFSGLGHDWKHRQQQRGGRSAAAGWCARGHGRR